jgi:hypothetical protein
MPQGEVAGRVLHCEAGNHQWTRQLSRGRLPRSCPEHRTPDAKSQHAKGSAATTQSPEAIAS